MLYQKRHCRLNISPSKVADSLLHRTCYMHSKTLSHSTHISLTKEQQNIVSAPNGHYVITAVAGSGKTTTLAHRIKYLLEKGHDPKRILILMFNRAAQQDFTSKLEAVLDQHNLNPDVRTFHAMGYRLYQRFIREGYLPEFQNNILSEKECDYHLWRLLCQLLPTEALREAKRNKKEYVDIAQQFISTVKSGLDSPKVVLTKLGLDDKFSFLSELFERFEQWRKAQSRISYADMLYEPVMAIRNFPALQNLVTNKMDIILVDEYQDTNDIQHELLRQIAGTRANITVVGDPDQTIYEFRGAKPDYILHDFEKEFKDAVTLNLSYSFRYGHNISLLANHLISQNSGRQNLLCKSHENNPLTEVHFHPVSEENESLKLAQLLQNQTTEALQNSIILVRVWSQTVDIELALLEQNIPYKIDGHFGVFESIEMQSLRCLLELSSGKFQSFTAEIRKHKFDLLCHFPHLGLPDAQIKMLCANLALLENGWGKALLQSIPSDLNKIQTIKVERLGRALSQLEQNQSDVKLTISNFVEQIQLYEGIRSLSLSHDQAEEKVASIEGMIRFIARFQGKIESILSHLDRLQNTAKTHHQCAIHICTIHRAKGLEWDVVYIPGLNSKILPYSYRSDALSKSQLESERRLFYVAITRTKNSLHLFVPRHQKQNTQYRSRFEFEMNLKQSLHLGATLNQKKIDSSNQQTTCSFGMNEKISSITQRYAESMLCEVNQASTNDRQDKKSEEQALTQKQLTENSITKHLDPAWFHPLVKHCVLGIGEVTEEQANSFSVKFQDQQVRTFSKETAERFFSVYDG